MFICTENLKRVVALAWAAAAWGATSNLAWADNGDVSRDGRHANSAAASCLSIQASFSAMSSGRYWVANSQGQPRRVYGDMQGDGGGWQVLFNSRNPNKWGTTFGAAGRDEWGVDAAGVPDDITQLRLLHRATGEHIIIPITTDALYRCSKVGHKYIWNGTKYVIYNAVNLGISNTTNIYPPPEGYVLSGPPCNNDHQSWGFGHRAWIDDQQGWGWDSLTLGPTVFQIAVR